MRLGFTGTRRGMTGNQARTFNGLVAASALKEFHHGDCVGADDEAANIVEGWKFFDAEIICHPPVDETHRAFNQHSSRTLPPKTHFARNRDIVDATDFLVATPCEMERQDRGGTWYTISYALKIGKPVYIIWPDGHIELVEKPFSKET